MPFTETGKEKEKREAYYKANKEKGIRAEKERDYKMFGTTEQNIPAVDTMGNVTGMKSGGFVHHSVHVKKHSAGFKNHDDHMKSMCGGGMAKGKK
jgi:hypothetical protein